MENLVLSSWAFEPKVAGWYICCPLSKNAAHGSFLTIAELGEPEIVNVASRANTHFAWGAIYGPFPTRKRAAAGLALLVPMLLLGCAENLWVKDGAVPENKWVSRNPETPHPSGPWLRLTDWKTAFEGAGYSWLRDNVYDVPDPLAEPHAPVTPCSD